MILLQVIKFMVVFVILIPIILVTLRIIFKNIHEHNSGRLMNISIKCNVRIVILWTF